MNTSKSSLGWILTGGSVVVAVVAILNFWDVYGWITRAAYAQDHEGASVKVQQQAIMSSLDTLATTLDVIKEEQKKNQDQWECDETDEELEDLIKKQDDEGLTSSEKRDKVKLEEVWEAKRCTRFTD